jgi:HSP90 family molecular chaperone
VSEDPAGALSGEQLLHRGTIVKMHVAEHSHEFLQPGRIEDVLSRFSPLINFPIFLQNRDIDHVGQERGVALKRADTCVRHLAQVHFTSPASPASFRYLYSVLS